MNRDVCKDSQIDRKVQLEKQTNIYIYMEIDRQIRKIDRKIDLKIDRKIKRQKNKKIEK